MCLNHTELVHKHPEHLVSPVTIYECALTLIPVHSFILLHCILMNMDSALSRRMVVHWGLLHQYHTRSALGHSLGVGSTRCTLILVVQYRTFSVYIVTGETRSAGCLCTSSGWFKHIEPHRIFSNHIITEITMCAEFCHMSSGWFDHTEPSLSGVQGAYALVRGGSSTSNLIEPSRTTSLKR